MDKNKVLHDLLGLPPQGHDVQGETCDHYYETWPDYAKNPILVLQEMMKQKCWIQFAEVIGMIYWVKLNDVRKEYAIEIPHYTVDIDLITDTTTGKLRDIATEWLKQIAITEVPPRITPEEAAKLPSTEEKQEEVKG